MNRTALAALVTFTLVGANLNSGFAGPPFFQMKPDAEQKEAPVRWQTDLQAAHKIATAENKPMLIVFGADWCHYCKKLEKETLGTAEISKYVNDGFIAVHLDADKEKRAAEILKVTGLPCSVVLSPGADLLGRIDGYVQPGKYYQKLSDAKQKHEVIRRTSVSQ